MKHEGDRYYCDLSQDYPTSCECKVCYWIVIPSFVGPVIAQ